MKIRDRIEAVMWLWVLGIIIMAEFFMRLLSMPFVIIACIFQKKATFQKLVNSAVTGLCGSGRAYKRGR